jgi:hypothetical protein
MLDMYFTQTTNKQHYHKLIKVIMLISFKPIVNKQF